MMEDDEGVRETGSLSPFKEARNSRAEKTHWKRDLGGGVQALLEISVVTWASWSQKTELANSSSQRESKAGPSLF